MAAILSQLVIRKLRKGITLLIKLNSTGRLEIFLPIFWYLHFYLKPGIRFVFHCFSVIVYSILASRVLITLTSQVVLLVDN